MVAARESLRKAGFGEGIPQQDSDRNGMNGRRNLSLAIQLCLCRKLRISSFYNLQHQIPDRCVLTAIDFSMPML